MLPQESGSYKPSFCSTILEGTEMSTDELEFDLKWTANSMYSGSADTVCLFPSLLSPLQLYARDFVQTITTVSHFLLAMMAYPEVLAKAQKEIDSVVGADRLPTFSDRPSLPYGSQLGNDFLSYVSLI